MHSVAIFFGFEMFVLNVLSIPGAVRDVGEIAQEMIEDHVPGCFWRIPAAGALLLACPILPACGGALLLKWGVLGILDF